MSDFKFQFGDSAMITVSNEVGIIIGRAQYVASENSYLVRYSQSGKAVETWWGDSALERAPDASEPDA